MAGSSQAVNLGGMLSQIGNTLGTKVDASGLMGNIQRMSQPELDPTSPESLMKQAQWANAVGNKEEAVLYGKRAAEMTEKQQAADVASREKGYQRSATGLTAAYENAMRQGNQEEAGKILQALQGVASQSGIDTSALIGAADERLRAGTPDKGKWQSAGDGVLFNTVTGNTIDIPNKQGGLAGYEKWQIDSLGAALPADMMARFAMNQLSEKEIAEYLLDNDEGVAVNDMMDLRTSIQNIDDLLESDVGGWTAALTSWAPGSEAMNQADKIERIRSKLSLDTLANLKKEGVSLGPITEKEWPKIEALLGTLNPKNPEGMKEILTEVKQRLLLVSDSNTGYVEGVNELSPERPVGYMRDDETGDMILVDSTGETPFMYRKNAKGDWTLMRK